MKEIISKLVDVAEEHTEQIKSINEILKTQNILFEQLVNKIKELEIINNLK